MVLSDEKLAQLLFEHKLLDQHTYAELSTYAKNSGTSISEALIEKRIVTEDYLYQLIAAQLHVPFVRLSRGTIPDDVLTIIPERLARKKKSISFNRDPSGVHVAMLDPQDKPFIDTLQQKTGQPIIAYLTTESDIKGAIQLYKKDLQKSFDDLLKDEVTQADRSIVDSAPVEKIVDLLINYAYQDKASDIHFEPEENESLVRFRIDGILHDVLVVPKNLHDRIVTRIKILSRLRTDEHLSAQDGKMRIKLEEENLDIRVSILPIVDGEKIVLRLLSSKTRELTLLDLGMNSQDREKVEKAYSRSYGMILSTGPTGSGKSTTIYGILKALNTREKNITTIEDPVEYRIQGVNQIQVNTRTNLTFAAGLRSILRQDPNIILVGEIRDNETAAIAVNAALTGHLVVSTLHTNDAATALPRLIDMKVEPFLVASTVNVIIGQRLVRKICNTCRISYTLPLPELTKHLDKALIAKHYETVGPSQEIRFYKGQGCSICRNTGYKGRIGLFEVLVVSSQIRKLITEMNSADVIYRAAIAEGMTTMLDDGLQKVSMGQTTIEEVLRVTKVDTV